MNPSALTPPSVSQLRSLTLEYRQISQDAAVNRGVPWDGVDYFGPSSVENISTAQSEYFWMLSGGIPDGISYAQSSPAVVKNTNDQNWATAQSYPAPPIGAVWRGVNRNGTLGVGNYLEITPVGWYIHVLLQLGDVATAQKLAQFASWMSVRASFYGIPIRLVRGVATVVNGAWVPKGDTILLRNQAIVAWGLYRLYTATNNTSYLQFARELMQPIALAINNMEARIASGEVASFMRGALYHAYVYMGVNEPDGRPRYALTWNRWTMEHLLGVVYMLHLARQIEGGSTTFYDPEGTPYTIDGLLTKVGWWVDAFFTRGWIMRRHNPRAPYLPYQFVIQQAWYNAPEYHKGVNFDWTEESGTLFGDTWWVGDLELWGILGMLRLKALGFTASPVERFLWDWLRLPGPRPYMWYDRYQFLGKPLAHDLSSPPTFSALYGLGLLEGYSPVRPPMTFQVAVSGGQIVINPEGGGTWVVMTADGNVVGTYTGRASIIPTSSVLIVEEI